MGLLSFFIILGIAIFSIQHWIANKNYLIDADEIANIAKKYSVIGHRTESKDIEVTFAKIAREFEKRYPGHILPKQDREWLFMNAGGWMGSFCLLHASLTEYVLFFGTAIDTSGHSGRYWANISDTMLVGSFTQWKEGKLHPNKFGPGDTINHAWGEVTAVHWTAGTWMVEYGRGFIPSTLGFALSDTVFSTQDFYLLFKIMKIYSKAIVQEIIATITHLKKSL